LEIPVNDEVMATDRPDLDTQTRSPPVDRTPGPSGIAAVLPLAGVMLLACVISALVLFGGWIAFGFAVALTIFGILALSRYVQRIAWTRQSRRRLRGGLGGMNEDLSITDDAHEEVSLHYLPLDSPMRHDIAQRAHRR
jgi:hypothetical protein